MIIGRIALWIALLLCVLAFLQYWNISSRFPMYKVGEWHADLVFEGQSVTVGGRYEFRRGAANFLPIYFGTGRYNGPWPIHFAKRISDGSILLARHGRKGTSIYRLEAGSNPDRGHFFFGNSVASPSKSTLDLVQIRDSGIVETFEFSLSGERRCNNSVEHITSSFKTSPGQPLLFFFGHYFVALPTSSFTSNAQTQLRSIASSSQIDSAIWLESTNIDKESLAEIGGLLTTAKGACRWHETLEPNNRCESLLIFNATYSTKENVISTNLTPTNIVQLIKYNLGTPSERRDLPFRSGHISVLDKRRPYLDRYKPIYLPAQDLVMRHETVHIASANTGCSH